MTTSDGRQQSVTGRFKLTLTVCLSVTFVNKCCFPLPPTLACTSDHVFLLFIYFRLCIMSELRAPSPACTGAWESRERAPTRGRSSHVEAAETAREATTSGRLPFPPDVPGVLQGTDQRDGPLTVEVSPGLSGCSQQPRSGRLGGRQINGSSP